jgi:drug/metabolite transporter (DMT)-like permease
MDENLIGGTKDLGGAQLALALGFALAGSSVIPGKAIAGLPVFLASASGAAIALVPLLPLAAFEARREASSSGTRGYLRVLARALPLFAVQALFGMALFRALMLTALARTSAAEVGMATSATPAITAILAALFLKERIGSRTAAGIALVVAGIAALDLYGISAASAASAEAGDALPVGGRLAGLLFAIAAAASESVFNVLAKRLPSRLGPMASSAVVTAMAFAMLAGIALATGETVDPSSLGPPVLAAIAYQGLFVSALAYILFYRGASGLPAATIGAFSGLIPLTGLLTSVMFLGERPNPAAAVGAVLALAGMRLCAGAVRKR